MKLLLDATSCPNTVIDYAASIAEQAGIKSQTIRERASDLYKVESRDFDDEIREALSIETMRPILDEMEPGDILVTADESLAELAIHRVTVVIHPDGKVYTPETMDMIKITKHLNRIRGINVDNPTPITHRNPKDDQSFRDLIIQYLGNVKS